MIQNQIARFRAARKTGAIKQSQLAYKIGVSRSYITKLEKGAVLPSLQIALKLADYFGCHVEEIFLEVPNRN